VRFRYSETNVEGAIDGELIEQLGSLMLDAGADLMTRLSLSRRRRRARRPLSQGALLIPDLFQTDEACVSFLVRRDQVLENAGHAMGYSTND
jgi:hypothetical protein